MNPVFDRDKMLRLIGEDQFLAYVWARSPQDDRTLSVFFNSHVLNDSVMTRAYMEA